MLFRLSICWKISDHDPGSGCCDVEVDVEFLPVVLEFPGSQGSLFDSVSMHNHRPSFFLSSSLVKGIRHSSHNLILPPNLLSSFKSHILLNLSISLTSFWASYSLKDLLRAIASSVLITSIVGGKFGEK